MVIVATDFKTSTYVKFLILKLCSKFTFDEDSIDQGENYFQFIAFEGQQKVVIKYWENVQAFLNKSETA